MTHDIQKAGLWKRIAAGMLDGILLAVLSVGIAFLLGEFLGYDGYNTTLNESYAHYEEQYGIQFQITGEEYEKMLPEQKDAILQQMDRLIKEGTAE